MNENKKLYEVTTRVYVMAVDADEACEAVSFRLSSEEFQAHPATGYDHEWADCRPYGGDDDRTVAQIWQDQKVQA